MAPPKYEQIPQGDGGRDDSGFDDVEHFFSSAGQSNATTSNANSGGDSQYPPAGYTSSELATAAMTDATASTSGKRTNVIYTFTPRYPIPGTTQSAMGMLAPDRLETVKIVQRGFPVLANYLPQRIEFLAPIDGSILDTEPAGGFAELDPRKWAIVMDDAWERFGDSAPSRLQVRVKDGPGDAAERAKWDKAQKNKKAREPLYIVLGSIGGVFAFFGLMIFMAVNFDDAPV